MNIEQETLTAEKHNELPDVLRVISPYWRAIVGILLLTFIGISVFAFITNSRKKSQEAGWTAFLNATANQDPSALKQIADVGDQNISVWAQHAAAQANLIEACKAVHTDRDSAKAGFEDAVEGFNKAIGQAGTQELIHKRSLWGLAQAYEGLNDLNKAQESYQKIVDTWPDSSIATQAKDRVESLSDPSEREFYTWFFAQTPPAILPSTGEVPTLPFEAPSTPDFSLPGTTTSDDETSSVDETSGEDTLVEDAVIEDTFADDLLNDSTELDLTEPDNDNPGAVEDVESEEN